MAKHNIKASASREPKEAANDWKSLLKRILISTVLGALVFAALLLPAAVICLQLDLPPEFLPIIAIPLAGIAAAIAAYAAVRPVRKQGLMVGALTAAALYVVLLLASWMNIQGPLGLNAVLLLLTMLLGGALGGVASANKIVASRNKR